MGWSASGKASQKSPAMTRNRWVGSVCKPSDSAADADHSTIATIMSNDPLVSSLPDTRIELSRKSSQPLLLEKSSYHKNRSDMWRIAFYLNLRHLSQLDCC